MRFLTDCLADEQHEFAAVHDQQRCESVKHLRQELTRIESLGGEGLMLREPGSPYEVGRSNTLLKVKTFHDAEALVVDHQPGKGKHKGRLGALVVTLDDGTQFSVGTGFSDAQRESPPPVGSRITFRYQELSDAGVPRFPSFIRTRRRSAESTAGDSTTAGKQPAALTKSVAKKPLPQPATAQAGGGGDTALEGTRCFELSDGKSHKFWEISSSGTEVAVRYGRIGSNGTTKVKTFGDAAAVEKHVAKLIAEKTGKGYVET